MSKENLSSNVSRTISENSEDQKSRNFFLRGIRRVWTDLRKFYDYSAFLFFITFLMFLTIIFVLFVHIITLSAGRSGFITVNVWSIIFNTLLWGSFYLLAAVGLTFTYKLLKFPNFAHAEFILVGGYTGLFLQSWNIFQNNDFLKNNLFLFSMFFAFISAGLVAVLSDIFVFKPLRDKNASAETLMISSLGLALLLRGLIYIRFSGQVRQMFHNIPFFDDTLNLDNFRFRIGLGRAKSEILDPLTYSISYFEIIIFLFSLTSIAVLIAFLNFTKIGKAMRAVADNPDLAASSGINVQAVNRFAWFIGGGLAGVAGVMYAVQFNFRPTVGVVFLLPAFAVIILGSIGSLLGVLFAAYLIGFARGLSFPILQGVSAPLERNSLGTAVDATPFALLILLLLIYPSGIGDGIHEWRVNRLKREDEIDEMEDSK